MGVRSFVKNTIKNNTDVKKWSSWDAIVDNVRVIKSLITNLKEVSNTGELSDAKSFDEAVTQAGLTEKTLHQRMIWHRRVAFFCVLLTLAAWVWVGICLIKGMILSSLVAFSVSVLMASYAFREHFFYFQIKQRRLNCTVKEWFSSFLRG